MQSKLHKFGEEHIQRLIEKYEGRDFGSQKKLTFAAADFITDVREVATHQYRTPFLEQFYAVLNEQGKALNHVYVFWKYFFRYEESLYDRTHLGINDLYFNRDKDDVIMLDKKKSLYLEKGVVIKALENMEATKTLDYIKKAVKQKHPVGPSHDEIPIYVFDLVRETLEEDEMSLYSLVKDDLESNGDTRLIYKV